MTDAKLLPDDELKAIEQSISNVAHPLGVREMIALSHVMRLLSHIAAQAAEIERMKIDAGRYRALRAQVPYSGLTTSGEFSHEVEFDRCADKMLEARNG